MKIIIHRGTHQIGGCVTEIRTANARILIDFGAELDGSTEVLQIDGVTGGLPNCDGVFFTHYHGDHMGMMDAVDPAVPLYMGAASKEILMRLNARTKRFRDDVLQGVRTFTPAAAILAGDITVTPFMVDHSAYDAYMFLIEADGKRVLHTGDFRAHGFRGKALLPMLRKYVGTVDALLCEGTTLHRPNYVCVSESELREQIRQVLMKNPYVFVLCSSTNIDRIASVCSVVPRGKYCLCDAYQWDLLQYIRESAGQKSSLYRFDRVLQYGQNLEERMRERGFCMFVRSGNDYHRAIMARFPKATVIYSLWDGYLKETQMQHFLEGFSYEVLHTSGHADGETIRGVIDTLQPQRVIPLHTEVPEVFSEFVGQSTLCLLQDGACVEI